MDFLDTFNQAKPQSEESEELKNENLTVEEGPRGARGVNGLTGKDFTYKVKVTHPSLRMRCAPNTQAEVYGLITDQGIYEIVDEVNGWGLLRNGYWIMLSYTEII